MTPVTVFYRTDPEAPQEIRPGMVTIRAAASLALILALSLLLAGAPNAQETGPESSGASADGGSEEDPEEPSETPEARRDQLEVIKVTARKREESLEDTPVSVTPLGERLLEEAQVRQLDQIQDLVPNMTWSTGFSGIQGSVSIRGVGKGAEDIVFDPGVGIYVDGIILTRDIGQVLPMLDIQQIEVLRGPQGTLFGKNTVGGAVNIRTVKPHDDVEAMLKVGYGNFNSLITRAMLNLPLVKDKLSTRLSWASDTSDGYTTNELTGQETSDRGLISGMASLRWQPVDQITVDVSGSWSRNRTNSRGGKCVYQGLSIAAQFADALIDGFSDDLPVWCAESGGDDPFTYQADVDMVAEVESYGVWGTIEWDAGTAGPVEEIVLKSITGWREQVPRMRDDIDMTRTPIIQRSTVSDDPFADPVTGVVFFSDLFESSLQRQISQELQLDNGWLDGAIHSVTGLYFFWDDAEHQQELISLDGEQKTDPPPPFADLRALAPNLQITSIDNFDMAVYHQSTWDVWEWLSLTAGVRWTREEKKTGIGIFRYFDPPSPGPDNIVFDFGQADSVVYTEWTPMASIVGKLPQDWVEPVGFDVVNAYFTYARGFKGGGFGAVQGGTSSDLNPFEPETLDSFEIGLKTTAWGQRIRANLAGFYGVYDNLQVPTTRSAFGGFLVERIVENAAAATIQGFELEITALPAGGLLMSASVGYLDSRFDEYTNSANNVPRPFGNAPPVSIDRSGDRFNEVPVWQTNVWAQYEIPLEFGGPHFLQGSLTPRLEWIYESEIQYGGRELPDLLSPQVHRLNARLAWRFNDDATEIALWGKNLTNAEYFRAAIFGTASTYGYVLRYYEAPRTYGFEVTHHF
jgi:iron complex outermembrane receptor protein